MTVGIAALALQRKAIVLMADKMFTLPGDLKIEGDEAKAMWLPNGWVAMYAGSPTFAEAVVAHAPVTMEKVQQEKGGVDPLGPFDVMSAFHKAYLDAWEFFIEQEVLRPRLVTADQYRVGVEDPATREVIQGEIDQYERDRTAEFLLCGFDGEGDGFILRIDLRTIEHEGAFGVVGSGSDTARARLIWQRTNANDELARALYEAYTAKAHAEMNAFVGPSLDAFVMYGNGRDNLRLVSEDTKKTLATVFKYHDLTPFQIARRKGESQAPPAPPADWERVLIYEKLPLTGAAAERREHILIENRYAHMVEGPKKAGEADQSRVVPLTPSSAPIETAPPSSQSPNDERR